MSDRVIGDEVRPGPEGRNMVRLYCGVLKLAFSWEADVSRWRWVILIV